MRASHELHPGQQAGPAPRQCVGSGPARRLRRLAVGLASAGLASGLVLAAPAAAHAAVPDKWGFAYIDNPSVAGIPDLNHQAGSWPAAFHAHSAPVERRHLL